MERLLILVPVVIIIFGISIAFQLPAWTVIVGFFTVISAIVLMLLGLAG